MICCYQVTKIFCSRYGSAIASSARGSCNNGPQCRFLVNWISTMFTQILTSLGCGLKWYFMRRTDVRVSVFKNFIIDQIFPEFFCSHSKISELAQPESANNGCPRSIMVSFLFVWCSNSSNRKRRLQIIHWINHPQHSFRRNLWTSTYLSLESYLPTSKRCRCGEFHKMRIRNLQSLLVGLPHNSLKNLPH